MNVARSMEARLLAGGRSQVENNTDWLPPPNIKLRQYPSGNRSTPTQLWPTDEEVRSASLQFVRKVSGFNTPSHVNEAAFNRAVEEVTGVARRLVDDLVTTSPPRNREQVSARARARYAQRFGRGA
jgi:hypothetical protein